MPSKQIPDHQRVDLWQTTYTEGNPDLAHPAGGYSSAQQLSSTATTEILVAATNSPVSGQQEYSVEGSQYPYLTGAGQGKIWYKETATGAYTAATINIQPLAALAYASSNSVITVGKQGTILVSSDAGAHWQMVYSGTENNLSAVSASGNTAVAISAAGTVLYSSTAGAGWNTSATAITAPTGVKVINSTVFITAGTTVYKSINGGASFTAETLTPAATATLRSVWLDADGYGFIAGDAGMAYRIKPGTTANTFSYTQIATDANISDDKGTGIPNQNLVSVQFSDRLTGYITGTAGLVLKTVDGGYHWKFESAGTGTGTPIIALSSDAQNGSLIGADGSVQSLNDQAEQFNSRFWYDELGRLVLSQNAKQFNIVNYESAANLAAASTAGGTVRAYSYTLYDVIGRITEVGEILTDKAVTTYKNASQVQYNAAYVPFVAGSFKHQVSATYYDLNPNTPDNFTPTYLRDRISYVTYQQEQTSPVQQTHYSYDVHGNVKSLLQVINHDGITLAKRADYEYDLVSGKVNKVYYQQNQPDQLIHKYSYDADNRITKVETSTDGIIYTKEASYDYYAHGPLARTTIGELGVETQDNAYTIQGWIKQVQGQAFAYALGYNDTDYKAIGTTATILPTPIVTTNGKTKGLYNGNIAGMTSNTPAIAAANFQQQYEYDQLNRITASYTPGTTNNYKTGYSYDANGNIQTLSRYDGSGVQFDQLTYSYETKANGYEHTTNKLRAVYDAIGTTATTADIENQAADNYSYDAIGNLLSDKQEEIDTIKWTVSGKVKKVIRKVGSTKPNLEFEYDASGQRIAKKVIKSDGTILSTYYLRDATGNVMSVYAYNEGTDNAPVLSEQYIYGSSRVGVATPGVGTVTNVDGTVLGSRAFGRKSYELSDHLGNVRATLSDYRRLASQVTVNSATDYYPFGMVARAYTSSQKYRYGFNGKEQDSEGLGGNGATYDYGFRIYNPNIARFLSVDPLSPKFPMLTPYQFASNTPIWAIDLDGKEAVKTNPGTDVLIIFIEGYKGVDPKDNKTQEPYPDFSGLSALASTDFAKTCGKTIQIAVFASSHSSNTQEDVAKTIMNYIQQNPNGKVILAGHSLGADNLVELVNNHPEIKVDLLITLDIMDTYQDDNIPSNVKNVINYRQTEDMVIGENIEVDDPIKTNSADVIAPGSTHTSIDNDLSGRVRGHIEASVIGGDVAIKKEVEYANKSQPAKSNPSADEHRGTNPSQSTKDE